MLEHVRADHDIQIVVEERHPGQIGRVHVLDVTVVRGIDVGADILDAILTSEPEIEAEVGRDMQDAPGAAFDPGLLKPKHHHPGPVAAVTDRTTIVLAPHAADDLAPVQHLRAAAMAYEGVHAVAARTQVAPDPL